MTIRYSQCWEDPLVLEEAFKIKPDDTVLSISSAGDNTLYILSKGPAKVVAIDINEEQNYLLEIKAIAIKKLDYTYFLEFLGFKDSKQRIKLYESIRGFLSEKSRIYWDKNKKSIDLGVINIGKFEKYLSLFRRKILPFAHSKKEIYELIRKKSNAEQITFYNKVWDNWRWRLIFRLFFSKTILRLLGRDNKFFKYSSCNSVSEHYLLKAKRGFLMLKNNYFLDYIATGKYNLANLPEYAKKENYLKIRNNLNKLEIVKEDLAKFIIKCEAKNFSKFNLSDVFEIYSQEEYESIIKEIARVSKKGSILCYWNNLVERFRHKELRIKPLFEKSKSLSKKDRVFFYNRLIIEKLM